MRPFKSAFLIRRVFVATIAAIQRDFIRLGFQRPENIPVQQQEVYRRIREEELPGPPVELPEQWHDWVNSD